MIDARDVRANQGGYVLCLSYWDISNLVDIEPAGGTYVYSSSEAYSEEQAIDQRRLVNWLDHFGFRRVGGLPGAEEGRSHASGHADGPSLEELIEKILGSPGRCHCPVLSSLFYDSMREQTGHQRSAPPRGAVLERVTVLVYATTGSVATHRAVMRVFADAKSRYVLQLRPDEVLDQLRESGFAFELPEGGVQAVLDALVDWGNLERSQDTRRAATLEEFRRRHSVYTITPEGEAAERLILDLEDSVRLGGSLRAVMLEPILQNLRVLASKLESDVPDPTVCYRALFDLLAQFDALAENASAFMGSLNRAIESADLHTEAFLAYKQAVVAYIQQFLAELTRLAPPIAEGVQAVERLGADRLVEIAAGAEQAPTLDGPADPAEALARRWSGVVAWFLPTDGKRPTVEQLRAAALDAVVRILALLDHINERRFRRVNRTADLLRLASWFSGLPDDVSAHRLFQGAFGLAGARHVGAPETDPGLVPGSTSWFEAPAAAVAPQLRALGSDVRRGRSARVEDNSLVKASLRERLRLERRRLDCATQALVVRGSFRMSELPALDDVELHVLLAFLDRVLSAPGTPEARSRDGRFRVRLEHPRDGGVARVRTASGTLVTPDFLVTLMPVGTLTGARA